MKNAIKGGSAAVWVRILRKGWWWGEKEQAGEKLCILKGVVKLPGVSEACAQELLLCRRPLFRLQAALGESWGSCRWG